MNELPLRIIVAKFSDNYISVDINRPISMTIGPGHTHLMLTEIEYEAILEAQAEYKETTS